MIQDVILDVKNKKGFCFPCLILFLRIFLSIPHAELGKRKKGLQNLKDKSIINGNGKRGIRTLGTNSSYNGLAIRRFSPLSHLSQLKKVIITMLHYTWSKDWKKSFFLFLYYINMYNFYQQFHLDISKGSKDPIDKSKEK